MIQPSVKRPSVNRRTLLAGFSTTLAGCSLLDITPATPQSTPCADDWAMAEQIRAGIQVPTFPQRDFVLTDFLRADEEDVSAAMASAIRTCHEAGGGRVVVPPGEFLCGPVHLQSGVNLHISAGATLRFHTDPNRYLPAVFTRWEGMELMGYSPLIYAFGQSNIALSGAGTLDGQASMENWWPWKGNEEWGRPGFPSQDAARQALMDDVAAGVPVAQRRYADGAYLRPPFVQFYQCRNVLIEGVRIRRAPFWLLNPVLCEHVTVRGVQLQSLGPNSDGCNPESCRNVLIENCFFDTGDDCIAIKSGRNADGRRIAVASENIVIRGCQMRAGHGGIVIGSEISGGARNIFAENCHMSSPDLERGLRIKTNSVRGGLIEHLRFRNILIGHVKDALVINFYYEEGDAGAHDPTVRDVVIENLLCDTAERVFQVRGFERKQIEALRLTNVHALNAGQIGIVQNVEGLLLESVSINGRAVHEIADER